MILNFSEKYPPGHRLAGQPTEFIAKILDGRKVHTIRENIGRFQKSMYGPNGEDRPIKLQIYTGARSKAAKCHTEKDFQGYNEVLFYRGPGGKLERVFINLYELHPDEVKALAKNDGFENVEDFAEWMFLGHPPGIDFIRRYIILWEDIRY